MTKPDQAGSHSAHNASSSPYQTLKVTQEGSLVRLTLCRPDLLNRVDEPAHVELIRVFRELSQNQSARAVLWTR